MSLSAKELDFFSAVSNNNLEQIKTLLAKVNVNIKNENGNSPLHLAQSLEAALILVHEHADIDSLNNNGEPPLFFAANTDVEKLLLSYGANVDVISHDKANLLHFFKTETALKRCLLAGFDINSCDQFGRTALHYTDTLDKAKLLIRYGADLSVRDAKGNTPLKYMHHKYHHYFLNALQKKNLEKVFEYLKPISKEEIPNLDEAINYDAKIPLKEDEKTDNPEKSSSKEPKKSNKNEESNQEKEPENNIFKALEQKNFSEAQTLINSLKGLKIKNKFGKKTLDLAVKHLKSVQDPSEKTCLKEIVTFIEVELFNSTFSKLHRLYRFYKLAEKLIKLMQEQSSLFTENSLFNAKLSKLSSSLTAFDSLLHLTQKEDKKFSNKEITLVEEVHKKSSSLKEKVFELIDLFEKEKKNYSNDSAEYKKINEILLYKDDFLKIEKDTDTNPIQSETVIEIEKESKLKSTDEKIVVEQKIEIKKEETTELPLDFWGKIDVHDFTLLAKLIESKTLTHFNYVDKNSKSLVMRLIESKQIGYLEAILKAGANPNTPDSSGDTPLHKALNENTGAAFIRLLLEYNCNPSLKNNKGLTAHELALQKENLIEKAVILDLLAS